MSPKAKSTVRDVQGKKPPPTVPSLRAIEVEFSINLSNPVPLLTGLTQKDVVNTMRDVMGRLHEDTGRIECYNCGATGLRKSDLVHVAPLRPQTHRIKKAVCYDCLQCTNDNEPWMWCRDCNPDGSESNVFVPIQQLTEPGDPNAHEIFEDIIHAQNSTGQCHRIPCSKDADEKKNIARFKRMSTRSWTQLQLVNEPGGQRADAASTTGPSRRRSRPTIRWRTRPTREQQSAT